MQKNENKCTSMISNLNLKKDEKKTDCNTQFNSVLEKNTFILKRPSHFPTIPKTIILHTELRAKSRKDFDEYLKQRAKDKAELQQRRKFEEEKEVALLRKKLVHKAQTIKKYKPLPKNPKPTTRSTRQQLPEDHKK